MARASDPALARDAATRVVQRLRDAGHLAYFAGGCVRDELLALDPTDYDVATDATPDRVAALFPRTMLVGAAFGVVLVQLPHATIEVATFRSDGPYSDARRPDRIHFSDPQADAQRRDFTINALFLDPLAIPLAPPLAPPLPPLPPASPAQARPVRGRVIDYVGGMADLARGVVRAVGDPDARLAEDHLRALRAVRFAARLSFELDPGTATAISRHASDLRGVSRERIGEEVRRMLMHPTRAAAVALLQSLALDAPVLDAPHVPAPIRTLARLRDAAPSPRYATFLAAWALDRGEASPHGVVPDATARSRKARSRAEGLAARWRDALRLSNDERDELAAVLHGYGSLLYQWHGAGVAMQKRLAGSAWFPEALHLINVREPEVGATIAARVEELRRTPSGLAPDPLIDGDDLVAWGINPGPKFKGILDAIYDAQLEGAVTSRDEARELVAKLCV